jgi:hypothetical protein
MNIAIVCVEKVSEVYVLSCTTAPTILAEVGANYKCGNGGPTVTLG